MQRSLINIYRNTFWYHIGDSLRKSKELRIFLIFIKKIFLISFFELFQQKSSDFSVLVIFFKLLIVPNALQECKFEKQGSLLNLAIDVEYKSIHLVSVFEK